MVASRSGCRNAGDRVAIKRSSSRPDRDLASRTPAGFLARDSRCESLELSGLIHAEDDVTAAYQFAVDKHLRERRPFGVLRQVLSVSGLREDVNMMERGAARFERLYGPHRKSALRKLRSSLHEDNDSMGAEHIFDLIDWVHD